MARARRGIKFNHRSALSPGLDVRRSSFSEAVPSYDLSEKNGDGFKTPTDVRLYK